MIRVLLVDYSASIRSILRKAVTSQKDMMVCGTASDGLQAVQAYSELQPDIVIMDFDIPAQNGLDTFKRIIEIDPNARVLMSYTEKPSDGNLAIEALSVGTFCHFKKPSLKEIEESPESFSKILIEKLRTCLTSRENKKITGWATAAAGTIALRKIPTGFHKADIIAIGSSTGGVQAILSFLAGLGTNKPGVPIVITQHMPVTYTRIFAQHIEQKTGMQTFEAAQGMIVEKDCVYVAPGGTHMEIVRRKTGLLHIHLSDDPPENFCKPSVDPMLRSLMKCNISSILMVTLTGMGNDGLSGAKCLSQQGHILIAQDEASSVVWGMPGAVAVEGICNAVLPLNEIAGFVKHYL